MRQKDSLARGALSEVRRDSSTAQAGAPEKGAREKSASCVQNDTYVLAAEVAMCCVCVGRLAKTGIGKSALRDSGYVLPTPGFFTSVHSKGR